MRKYVLFGAGRIGQVVADKIGNERIVCFVDNYKKSQEFCSKRIVDIAEMVDLLSNSNDIRVLITVSDLEKMFEIGEQLEDLGIVYDTSPIVSNCAHFYGRGSNLQCDYDPYNYKGCSWRVKEGTLPMIKDSIKYCKGESQKFDFWVYYLDSPYEAERIRRFMRRDHIFAYSTCYSVAESVIAIPDYRFLVGMDVNDPRDYSYAFDMCAQNRSIPYSDNRLFWSGNVLNDGSRMAYSILARKYPEKLACNTCYIRHDGYNRGDFIPMIDFMKYKYLIDARGYGWTDRVKFLLAMGRPLFLVERPYEEYYFDGLIPMEHYIPVKEDLSDLIQKLEWIEEHTDVAKKIVGNDIDFVKTHFQKKDILTNMFERICNYGVKEDK